MGANLDLFEIEKRTSDFQCDVKKTHYCDFIWCLKETPDQGKEVFSREFSLASDCRSKFKVGVTIGDRELYELRQWAETDQYVPIAFTVGLERTDSLDFAMHVVLAFTLRGDDKTVSIENSLSADFTPQNPKHFCDDKTSSKLEKLNAEDAYDQFQMVIKGKIFASGCCDREISVQNNINEFQKDILKPLRDKLFTDVTFKIGQVSIPAHSFILSARSPVFQKMLEHDMKEKKERCIEITDIEQHVFEAFLTFLYSGILEEHNTDTILKLYPVADKYDVKSLQFHCREILQRRITERTAPQILNLADLHGDEDLKEEAIEYIAKNFSEIEGLPEWECLLGSNTRLVSKVFGRISEYIKRGLVTD